jgi:Flp pilus assembly protein TadD
MSRVICKCGGFFIVALAGVLVLSSLTLAQPKGGKMMEEDVSTPLAKGYEFLQEGKYEAAKYEFGKAAERDSLNPFALNNLAALLEREGKLNDALANLKDAATHAAEYKDKVVQTCFVGGLCTAVKPAREMGPTSTIAPIIQENIQKLQNKIAQTKTPPPPKTLQPMKQ